VRAGDEVGVPLLEAEHVTADELGANMPCLWREFPVWISCRRLSNGAIRLQGGPSPGVFMSWHTKSIKWGACTVGALTAAILAVSTSPAAASGTYSGLDYVYGSDGWVGDWSNEGVLSVNMHASSNATCMWQAILWADGKLASLSDVDGVFGNKTYNATRSWQSAERLTVDGVVGKATFGRAELRRIYRSGSYSAGQTVNFIYEGKVNWLSVKRDADGNYQFWDGSAGVWRKAGYNYRTCT
jgi:peptidoglycan hydrolase-like protein with peptidoglycan-binding domain